MGPDDPWRGLSDFIASMSHWRTAQNSLALTVGSLGYQIMFYDRPYLDGDRIVIPNGPANARDGEGYRVYSIIDRVEGFSICKSGVSRARVFTDSVDSLFGSFELAAKYFLYMNVCTYTLGRIDPEARASLSAQLKTLGLPANWSSRELVAPNLDYYDCFDANRFYVTFPGDTATSQMITKTFREINEVYSDALGLERFGIPLPDTST